MTVATLKNDSHPVMATLGATKAYGSEAVLWKYLSAEQRWLAQVGGIEALAFPKRLYWTLVLFAVGLATIWCGDQFRWDMASGFGIIPVYLGVVNAGPWWSKSVSRWIDKVEIAPGVGSSFCNLLPIRCLSCEWRWPRPSSRWRWSMRVSSGGRGWYLKVGMQAMMLIGVALLADTTVGLMGQFGDLSPAMIMNRAVIALIAGLIMFELIRRRLGGSRFDIPTELES